MGALFLVLCFIFIVFFAKNLTMLLVGEILCGIPWGVFQTLTTAYASEVCPAQLITRLPVQCTRNSTPQSTFNSYIRLIGT